MKSSLQTRVKSFWKPAVLVPVMLAFLLGYLWRREAPAPAPADKVGQAAQAHAQVWTCSMHPQIRQPGPGQCPICGMDLIPVSEEDSGESLGPRQLKLSPTAEKLAGLRVTPVERKFVEARIRMVGKVDYDESRLGYITARVPGRLDRLYVDYTGIAVREGDHLVYLYSPELLTAQEELLQALKSVRDLREGGSSSVRQMSQRTVEAAREKLRLWGLTAEQIEEIEARAQPSDHLTIYAPMGGIVVHKNAVEGMYVETGTRIYTIADLAHVWVRLDAYESDLPWIRYGQEVEVETEAYPGEIFQGKIAFIDPVLDEKTRTVKVRVNVPNPAGKLKPGMFVRAVARSQVAAGGKVMAPSLAGKWICPMHPEIVKEESGRCDICEMPLVRPESLGYTALAEPLPSQAPLVIPVSAPLITGERAVIYVAVPERPGVYEGREVILGPRAGDYYLVREGLREGESVVVNGNFKIDSAVQILAKPSMMNPEGGAAPSGHEHHAGSAMQPMREDSSTSHQHEATSESEAFHVPEAFHTQLDQVFSAYFKIQQALSQDDLQAAKQAGKGFLQALDGVQMNLLEGAAHLAWMKEQQDLKKSAGGIQAAENIIKAREAFFSLSGSLIAVAKGFGTSGKEPVLRFHCPMAFGNQGADWLQNKPGVENPYFGAAMFRCGEMTEQIAAGSPGSER